MEVKCNKTGDNETHDEKAVPKEALPSTLKQKRIDHMWDKNMEESYIYFHTAYTRTIEPTLPLSQYGIRVIQGEY